MAPAEDQHRVRPSGSVMVICVLLNDAATCTTPCGTILRSRFFLNSFLRLAAAPGFAGAAVSGAVFCCSFATFCSVSCGTAVPSQPLALLALDLLLGGHRPAPRPLAGARVGVRPLPPDRQVAAVPDPAVGLNFDEPADVHLDLLAEIPFHAALLLDGLAQLVHLVLGEVADLLGMVH